MRYTKILIYLLYVLVLLGSLAAAGWGFFTIKVWIGRHYRPLPGMAGYCLICIVIGLLLGLEHFLKEFRKQGRWTVNLIRLVIMGIPSGISAFYLVLSFAFSLKIPSFMTYSTLFYEFSGLIFGYTIMTSFYKKTEKQTYEIGSFN
ncbi:hypothetical protein Desor_3617 [Desulfosporosinus orientis DSM 765]|uniref:Uncharacterized protein n=1 Tax=Desulfosporosinus orientis (strain ATCC 19365 / DSM 765 / NCIMB 8382 / VKM B-1628 / Singapore I) TaxID=768706 RepID=G7WIM3_DESOD|nr:hypothetical protein [Desulfosporosinus orientis]AET69097.1 hypothetical protein Desor_3617 [Desulfosporosinus orientis DSM 765]